MAETAHTVIESCEGLMEAILVRVFDRNRETHSVGTGIGNGDLDLDPSRSELTSGSGLRFKATGPEGPLTALPDIGAAGDGRMKGSVWGCACRACGRRIDAPRAARAHSA